MACLIEQQQNRIIQDIHFHFSQLKNPQDFKVLNYLKEVYALGKEQGVKDDTALNYIQVIPRLLKLYLAAAEPNISMEEEVTIIKLERDFKQNNLQYIFDNIFIPQTPVVQEEPIQEEPERKVTLSLYNPFTNVVLSTTALELQEGTNIKDQRRSWHHEFNRLLLTKPISASTGAYSTALNNHRGFRLKAVKMSSIPFEELDPKFRDMEGQTESKAKTMLDNYKDVAIVVTDTAGNPLRFDKDYNVSPDGKLVFFSMRDTSTDITSENARGRIQSVKEISKNLGISEKEAADLITGEVQKLRNIQESVFSGQDVLLEITGGSAGIIRNATNFGKVTYDTAPTFLGELYDAFDNVQLSTIKEGENKGRTYATVAGNTFLVYNTNITDGFAREMAEATFNYLNSSKSRDIAATNARNFLAQYIAFTAKEQVELEEFLSNENLTDSIDKIYNHIVKKPNQSKNRFLAYQGVPSIAYKIENKTIVQTDQNNYLDFWKDKLKVPALKNEDGKIELVSSYLTFGPTEQSINIIEGRKEKTETVKSKKITYKGRDFTDNQFYKNRMQLSNASQKQIDEALEWYKSSPLSKILPGEEGFFRLFNIVNSNAKASFSQAGIRLYFGSNFTDLYHESWHAFSQLFLTREEKDDLYKELGKLSGTFLLSNGSRVAYSDALPIQLEEVLAEDFRQYKLSNGSKVLGQRPVRNKIFRYILKFLDWLFDGVSYQQASTNFNTLNKVHNYYKKLDNGTFADMKPDFANMMPGIRSLASPIGYDTDSALTIIESEKVSESIDSIISDIIYGFAKERNISIISDMFTSKNAIKNAYNLAKGVLEDKITELSADAETNDLALSILNRAIVNFGNIDEILEKENIDGNTTIEYHLRKSKILDFRTKEFSDDTPEDSPDYISTKENQEDGKLSFEELANERVLYLIRTLKSYKEENGEYVVEKNELGFDKLTNYRKTLGILINNLSNNTGPNSIYKKLLGIRKPEIKELIDKLGVIGVDTEISDRNHFKSWVLFSNSFNTSKLPLLITKFDQISEEESEYVRIYNVQASSDFTKIRFESINNFKTSQFNNKYADEVNGQMVLNMNKVVNLFDEDPRFTFLEAFDFFKGLGIPLDNKLMNEYTIDKEFVKKLPEYARYIFRELKQFSERNNVKLIENHIDLLTNGSKKDTLFKTQKTVIDSIFKKHIEVSDLISSYSILNANNEREYENVLNSFASITQNTINESQKIEELYSKPGFEHFDERRNPMMKASLTLKRLFDERGNKRKDSNIELSKFSGVQAAKNGTYVEGNSTIESDPVTKFYLDLYSYMLSGFITNPTPADKKTYIGFYSKDSSGEIQFIKPKTFLDGTSAGDSFFENIMFEYLKAEHERVYDVRNNLVRDVANLGNFSKNGKYFLIFDNILNKTTKKELYELSPADLEKNVELIATIKNEITEYLNKLTEQNIEVFNKIGFEDESVIRRATGVKKITNNVNNNLIKAFTANSFIQFVESTILFYGDIAAYKLLAEDFHKRNSAASSSGRTMVSDPNFIRAYSNLFGYGYAKSKGYTSYGISSDGYINTAIFEDIAYENKQVMEEYMDSWKKAYTTQLKKLGLSKSEIDEKVNDLIEKQIKSYKEDEVKEGDAQGWVTFDAYRFFSIMSNEWSNIQEDVYNDIINGKTVDPTILTRIFPPRKYQFYGPLETSKYHVNALHKFSLLPLIPTVIQGKNISKLHERMMKNNVHYATFKTGSKVGIKTNNDGSSDSFYKDRSTRTMEDIDKPLVINKINLKFLRNQVPINDYYKNKVVFSTQLRALIYNDLYEAGIPINKGLGEKVKRYIDSVDAYVEASKDEIKEQINFNSRKNTYNAFELAKIIKRELDRREIPEHLQAVATTINGQSFAFDLSLAKNAADIERIIFSIANKRIVKRKFNGEPLFQAASSGFEQERLTNPTEEDIAKYKNDDLLFYRIDPVTGEKLPMDIKIAMQGDFKKLLYNEDVKKLAKDKGITTLQALNILIKDEKWLNKPIYPENSIYAKAFAKMESKKGDTKMFVLKSDLTPELLEQLTPDTKDGKRIKGGEYFGIKIIGDFYSHNTIKSRDGDNLDVIVVDNKADAEKQLEEYKKGGAKNFTRVVPLKKDTNKMFLRTVGVRIPVQGHNSMEYMQIAEFLPEEAGPIVIVPSYIVAKAGSDFDIDKLSVFFPNISSKTSYNLTEKDIKSITQDENLKDVFAGLKEEGNKNSPENIVKNYVSKLNNREKITGLSENEKILLNEIKKFVDIVDIRYAYGNNIDGLENQIMKNMIEIFNTDEVFNMMTVPNGTYLVKGVADDMVQYFESDYSPANSFKNWDRSDIPDMRVSPTNIFELQYNYYKQYYNAVGKRSLGIGANVNKIKALFNQVGFRMSKTYTHYRTNSKGEVLFQEREIRMLLDHIKTKDGAISLSSIYNVDGIKISDLINQLMNGWLDVAKDPWVAYVMGTPEATPSLLYLVASGVSFKNAVYFLAQPIIREYFSNIKKLNSPTRLLDNTFTFDNEFQIKRTYLGLDQYASGHTLFQEIMNSTNNALSRNPNLFTTSYLQSKLNNSKSNFEDELNLRNPENKAILAHFFEINEAAQAIAKVQQSFNFDTKTSSTLYDTFRRSKKRDLLIDEDDESANYSRMFPKDKLQALYSDTILSTFDISDIQTSIFSNLFPIRDNENLNEYIYGIYRNDLFFGSRLNQAVNDKLGNHDRFVAEFKNDFTTAMVLKTLNDFNIDNNKYKGFDIVEVKRDAFKRDNIYDDSIDETIEQPVNKQTIQPGLDLYKSALTPEEQKEFFKFGRSILEQHGYNPFPQYVMASAGEMEWSPETVVGKDGKEYKRDDNYNKKIISQKKNVKGSDGKGRFGYHYYMSNLDGSKITPIPKNIIKILEKVTGQDMSDYDTVLINLYPIGRNLGWHVDVSEDYRNLNRDIISVSIGADADFTFANTPDDFISGDPTKAGYESNTVNLNSGDIITFGEDSRLISHTVTQVSGNTDLGKIDLSMSNVNNGFKGGLELDNWRMNFTFRVADPENNKGKRLVATTPAIGAVGTQSISATTKPFEQTIQLSKEVKDVIDFSDLEEGQYEIMLVNGVQTFVYLRAMPETIKKGYNVFYSDYLNGKGLIKRAGKKLIVPGFEDIELMLDQEDKSVIELSTGLEIRTISLTQSKIIEELKDIFKAKNIRSVLEKSKKIDANKPDTIISRFEQTTASVNPLVTAGVKPTDMSGNAAKDIQMAEESTQFIGYQSGTAKISSTNKYREAWGKKANTGVYDSNDIIMVSGSGVWRGVTKEQIKETLSSKYKPLLEQAIEAGASFRVGNQYHKGNYADELIANYLNKKGYVEERLDGYSRWSLPFSKKAGEPKPVKKGNEVPRHIVTGVFIENEKIYLDYGVLDKIYKNLTDSDQTFVSIGNVLIYYPTKKTFNSFNEFVNYAIEKEYLRNTLTNDDIAPITNISKNLFALTAKKEEVLKTKQVMSISSNRELKNLIATSGNFVNKPNGLQTLIDNSTGEIIYDNVIKKRDTIEFYKVDEAKSLETARLKAIEMYLTDKALKNIYNSYSFTKDRLFNYPRQLMALIKQYPTLSANYILPGLFESVSKKNSSVKNLRLNTTENDAVFLAQLNEEFNKLSNEDVIKHENPEVNKYISNMFSMLPVFSLFTEGYSGSKGVAISDILDQTKLSEKMTIQNINKNVENELSDANYRRTLDNFTLQFLRNRLGLARGVGEWLYNVPTSETKNYLLDNQKPLFTGAEKVNFYLTKISENFYGIDLEKMKENGKVSGSRSFVSDNLNRIANENPNINFIFDVNQIKNIKITSPNIYTVSSPDELLKYNMDGELGLVLTGLPEKYDEVIPLVFGVVNPSKTGRLTFNNEKISNILNSNAIFTSADILQKIRAQAENIMDQINKSCNI